MSGNKIKRLLKRHFENTQLDDEVSFASNEIAYIEDGTFDHITACVSLWVITVMDRHYDFQNLTAINIDDSPLISQWLEQQ